MQACLNSPRPQEIIQAQASEASNERIAATPTVKLVDGKSGQTLVLSGPVEGDTLLSALDLLSADQHIKQVE